MGYYKYIELEEYSPATGGVNKEDGFYTVYKLICVDIDGIDKGEAPFAYGIRRDGKILNGARADEWLQKSIQEKD